MTMHSVSLMPALRELPGGRTFPRGSFREHIVDLVNTDRAFYAAELAAAASFGLWAIFDDINVDDGVRETITQAHEMAFDYDGTLTGHWQEMMERGPESMQGFLSALKGKAAEIDLADALEQNGFTNVSIAEDPTQPLWDISAIGPDGQEVFIQVKTGASDYAGEVQNLMAENPDIHYAVSTEIYDKIAESAPELVDRLTDIGADYLLVGGIEDGLSTLSANLGIDIPDGLGDIIPYAGAIIAGARLIYTVIQTEREFKAADRTTRNKIQVVQTLTLMSRMGVTTVLSVAGGMGGSAIGTAMPGAGNLVGGVAGTVAGAGMGMYLNRHLQPRMLDLALNITGLTNDDLFYYKNKPRIDKVALTFRQTAAQLEIPSTPPALHAHA